MARVTRRKSAADIERQLQRITDATRGENFSPANVRRAIRAREIANRYTSNIAKKVGGYGSYVDSDKRGVKVPQRVYMGKANK